LTPDLKWLRQCKTRNFILDFKTIWWSTGGRNGMPTTTRTTMTKKLTISS
jgi:hypothetical protein